MNSNDNEFSKLIIENMIHCFSDFTHLSPNPDARVESLSGAIRYFSGSSYPLFNGVFQTQFTPGIEKELSFHFNSIDYSFSEKKTPYVWWWLLQDEIPASVQKELDRLKFQSLGEFSGMLLPLNEFTPSQQSNTEIEVREVKNEDDFKVFMQLLSVGFQLDERAQKDCQAALNSYGEKGKFKHFIGYLQGKPGATLTSYSFDQSVGFMNGTTLPEFRKQGLCTLLGEVALTHAKADGFKWGVTQLMPPAMAKGPCEKLGFQKKCRFLPFLKN